MKVKTWRDRLGSSPSTRVCGVVGAAMQAEIDELREELTNALAASRYETDLCQQALESRDTLQKEVESLKAVIASVNPLLAAAKLAISLSNEKNDELQARVVELKKENSRLAEEVSNRNLRALEGDKAQAAFNKLFDEHELLRAENESLKAQLAVAYSKKPVAWMVYFDGKIGGAMVTDRRLVWTERAAKEQVKGDLIQNIVPLYTKKPT